MALSFAKILAPARINCPSTKWDRKMNDSSISGAGTGRGQGSHWPPQYFADQLTLFEPGRADYPHLLLLAPSMFLTFRHHC